MESRLEVKGADRLRRTMAAAARDLDDLEPADLAAARHVAATARQRAPRRTGYLASTIGARLDTAGAVAEATARYSAPVHNGSPRRGIRPNPFLTEAAEDDTPLLRIYDTQVRRTLTRIKGA